MPHPYTFTVDTVGCIVSLTTSILLQNFLNSRPLAERNLLNRQLLILVYCQYLYTSRAYIISFLAITTQTQLFQFMDNHPVLSSIILSPRPWSALLYTIYCNVSFSRLLLVLSPNTFINLNSQKGFYLTGLFILVITIANTAVTVLWCDYGENYKPEEHWLMASQEIGSRGVLCISNVTNKHNSNSTNIEKHPNCIGFPILFILLIFTFIFEVSKAVVFVTKRIFNKRKSLISNRKKTVNNTGGTTLKKQDTSIKLKQTPEHCTVKKIEIQNSSNPSNAQIHVTNICGNSAQPSESATDQDFVIPKKSCLNSEVSQSNITTAVIHIDVVPAKVDTREISRIRTKKDALTETTTCAKAISLTQIESYDQIESFCEGSTAYSDNKEINNVEIKHLIHDAESVIVQEEDIKSIVNENILPVHASNVTAESLKHTNSSDKGKSQVNNENHENPVWKEVLIDLKLLFYRTGTYMVFGCILYTFIAQALYFSKTFHNIQCKTPDNHFVYLCSRIAAYFSPVVWVAFDTNIRSYVFEEGKKTFDLIITLFRDRNN